MVYVHGAPGVKFNFLAVFFGDSTYLWGEIQVNMASSQQKKIQVYLRSLEYILVAFQGSSYMYVHQTFWGQLLETSK